MRTPVFGVFIDFKCFLSTVMLPDLYQKRGAHCRPAEVMTGEQAGKSDNWSCRMRPDEGWAVMWYFSLLFLSMSR